MLKKTLAIGGLVIGAASGGLLTASPSHALAPAGCGGSWCSSSHTRFFHRHSAFNANENELFNHIRLRIRNRNNNIAIARNTQAQAERQRQRQREDEDQFQDERRDRR